MAVITQFFCHHIAFALFWLRAWTNDISSYLIYYSHDNLICQSHSLSIVCFLLISFPFLLSRCTFYLIIGIRRTHNRLRKGKKGRESFAPSLPVGPLREGAGGRPQRAKLASHVGGGVSQGSWRCSGP